MQNTTTLILTRRILTNTSIIGELCLPDTLHRWYTLELPWHDNQTNISCIPEGTYKVQIHNSPRFGNCLKVLNVPNRTDILIHSGNTDKDTKGCILIGCILIKPQLNLSQSKIALNQLLSTISSNNTIELNISYDTRTSDFDNFTNS